MPIASDELEAVLRKGFPDAKIVITDLVGDQDHYQVNIESSQFKGLSKVKQHQLVYKILGDRMKQQIHAISLNLTST